MRAALLAAGAVLAAGGLSGAARADGDPASDILTSQALFLPQDAGVPAEQQAQLQTLLRSAQRSGYPIRVALVASRSDLGSITALWRQPESYARFLGQELSLVYRGPLLVVMPGGFGLYRAGKGLASERAALAEIRAPTTPAGVGAAALTAIQRLAAATCHALPVPTAGARARSSGTDPVGWIVFAIGAALIALAWAASLRARPLGAARRAEGGA